MKNKILPICDHLVLIILTLASFAALFFQLTLAELPCALCVMQRMGLYAISIGLLLNLSRGYHSKHYLMVILAALITSFMALIQILLHIVPGTGSYGDALWGLHLYTWTFILCMACIIYATLAGLFVQEKAALISNGYFSKILFSFLFISLILNIISAFMESGPYLCPSDPQSYWLLDIIHGKPWS